MSSAAKVNAVDFILLMETRLTEFAEVRYK